MELFNINYIETNTKEEFDKMIRNLPFKIEQYNYYFKINFDKNDLSDKVIHCDCRVGAMLLSCYYNPEEKYFYCLRNEKAIELYIPKDCYYMYPKFDCDNKHKTLLVKSLKDLQGQWIYKHPELDKYTGLVNEGYVSLTLEKWKEYYKNKIIVFIDSVYKTNKFRTIEITDILYGMIFSLIKLDKLTITLYSREDLIM